MPDAHANFATSLVAAAPSPASSGTSLTLTAGEGALFPIAPFNAVVCPANTAPKASNAEIVRVTSIAGDVVTMTRTQEATSARTILVGDQFFAAVTKKTLTDMEAGGPPPGTFSVHAPAALLGAAGAGAKVALTNGGAPDVDASGWFSNAQNRFQPQLAGYYRVEASATSTLQLAAGQLLDLLIYKNGAPLPNGAGATYTTTGVWFTTVSASALVYMNGTSDYLELWGGALLSTTAQDSTHQFTAVMSGFLATVAPSPPGAGGQGIFGAHGASTQLGSAGGLSKVPLGVADYDLSGWFSTANSRFQPTVAGYYQISAGVGLFAAGLASGDLVQLSLYKNNAALPNDQGASAQTGGTQFGLSPTVSKLVYLNGSSDYLELFGVCLTAAQAQVATACVGWMTGHLATPAPVPTVSPTYSELQIGVLAAADCAISGVSVAAGGGVSFTLAPANPLWIKTPTGMLFPLTFPGGAFSFTPVTLPATGKYRGYGVEVASDGTVSLATVTGDLSTMNNALDLANGSPLNGKLRVFDIVILNTAGTYSLPGPLNPRDRRPWARGGYGRIIRNQNASAGNEYTTSSASPVAIDAANLAIRLECVGGPVRFTLRGVVSMNGIHDARILPYVDGAAVDAMTGVAGAANAAFTATVPVASAYVPLNLSYDYLANPGSHLFQPFWSVTAAAVLTLWADAGSPVVFTVEEIVRANATNGSA